MTLEELLAQQPTDNHPVNKVPEAIRNVIAYLNDPTSGITALIPIGGIQMYGGASGSLPYGWHVCDGTALRRTDYSELFTVLSTTWGSGDGSTTFNLPNFQRRIPMGVGGTKLFEADTGAGQSTDVEVGITLGSTGGEEVHTILFDELPNIELPLAIDPDATPPFGRGTEIVVPEADYKNTTGGGYLIGSAAIESNNLPPVAVVNFIIRVK